MCPVPRDLDGLEELHRLADDGAITRPTRRSCFAVPLLTRCLSATGKPLGDLWELQPRAEAPALPSTTVADRLIREFRAGYMGSFTTGEDVALSWMVRQSRLTNVPGDQLRL